MSKKRFLEALAEARGGRLPEAIAILRTLDRGFVRKRIEHYKTQLDSREVAFRLEEELERSSPRVPVREAPRSPPPPAELNPLPALETTGQAPRSPIAFDAPEEFLLWLAGDWDRSAALDLDACRYTDVWVLVALASLRLAERPRRPPMVPTGQTGPSRFAHALGLNALTGDGPDPGQDERSRSVRLTRVRRATEIEQTADRMASLVVASPEAHEMKLAVRYVLVELLRNVLQHSEDTLGAVVAAQRMMPSEGTVGHMIQLAVADAGIGIPRSLKPKHPHLTDHRQALERALLPHISGKFEEGLTGSFENAGLGLFMISEIARKTGGRMLIATTGATLVLEAGSPVAPHTPKFLKPVGLGFPGTLVAFEIPTATQLDYHSLIQTISRQADRITPKRVAGRWLTFDAAPAGTARVSLYPVRENTPAAVRLAQERIMPAIVARRPIELDFKGLELCTQSFLHALLFEPVRLAWALRVPIHAVNAEPAVREGLRFLEAYALSG